MKLFSRNRAAIALGLVLAASIFEVAQVALLRARASRLAIAQKLLAAQIEAATRERNAAADRLAALHRENAHLDLDTPEVLRLRAASARLSEEERRATRDPDTLGAKAWIEKVRLLKKRFEQWPRKTPELQLLDEQDYLKRVAERNLDSDEAQRKVMSELRDVAKWKFGVAASQAARQFAATNNGQFPTNPYQLVPYLKPPMDSFLENYEIAEPGWVWRDNKPTWALVEKGAFGPGGTAFRDGRNHADPEYDSYMSIIPSGPSGYPADPPAAKR